jgi:hypothetical protein
MRIVCRRSRVRNPVASFLNPELERYELVCTGVHVRSGTSRYVVVCAGMYCYVPACQSHILVCTSTHNHLLVWESMYWYVLVCASMYLHVLVYTSIYSDFQFTNSVFPRYSIHDGTSKYMEVHGSTGKSCIPGLWWHIKVHSYTKPCTLKYLYLLWCTTIIQVYRTFWYCHVLPCTLMYRHVSSNG